MKAPEKIYVTECMLFATNPEITLSKNNSIEYTCTDAFIEKTEEFIYSALNDGIISTANIEDFMRLFKKYIEE